MPTPVPKGPPCINIPKTRLLSPPPPLKKKGENKKLGSFVMSIPCSSSQLIFLHATRTSPHSGPITGEHLVWPSWHVYQRRSHGPLEWETSVFICCDQTHFYGEPGTLVSYVYMHSFCHYLKRSLSFFKKAIVAGIVPQFRRLCRIKIKEAHCYA